MGFRIPRLGLYPRVEARFRSDMLTCGLGLQGGAFVNYGKGPVDGVVVALNPKP